MPDGLFILELDFCLSRVNIDIDATGIDEDLQEEWYLFSIGNESFVGTLYRFREVRVAHVASIGKEELLCAFFLATFGIADEANDLHKFCFHMNGHQIFVHLAAEDVDDALAEITGGEIEEYVVGS